MKSSTFTTLCFVILKAAYAGAAPVEHAQRSSSTHARRSLQGLLSWLHLSAGDHVQVDVGETRVANGQSKHSALVSVMAPFTNIQVKNKRDDENPLSWVPQDASEDQDDWDAEEQNNLSLGQEQAPTSGAVQE